MYSVSDAYKTAIAKQSRKFLLYGRIKKQSGAVIELTDGNVVGEVSISTQMMSGSSYDSAVDIGAVCAAKLAMTVQDDGVADSFAGARVTLSPALQLADGSYEYVKMGVFYIDNSSIQRVKNQVTFTAYDKMLLLDFYLTDTMRSIMANMTPYAAAAYLCGKVSIQMAQAQADVEAFPNGSLSLLYTDVSVETARDVVMWCAQMMGCFARMSRGGKLEFVQIKAEKSANTGMIIPVREIAANQRIKTTFADGVLQCTRLTMEAQSGKKATAYLSTTAANKRSMELELEKNPLLLSQTTVAVGSALGKILEVLKTAYFRPFRSDIANDPALDCGDYVRLLGGSIDSARGYATGIITHNTWRYRGKQTIVNVGSVPVIEQLDDEDVAVEVKTVSAMMLASNSVVEMSENTATLSDSADEDITGDEIVYAQPKAQSCKPREQGGGTAEKLQTGDSTVYATTEFYGSSGLYIMSGDYPIAMVTKSSSGALKIETMNGGQSITFDGESVDIGTWGGHIKLSNDGGIDAYANGNADAVNIHGGRIFAQSGNGSAWVSIYSGNLYLRAGTSVLNLEGELFQIWAGTNKLESGDGANANDLFWNGKKVLTEE